MRFLLALLAPMLLATADAPAPVAVGEPLPAIRGELLTGAEATLPEAVHGRLAMVAFGFTRGSSADADAWVARFKAAYGADSTVTWLEVPVMGGFARVMKGMITGAMRGGTPAPDRPHVMTAWGVADEWRKRLAVREGKPAYVVLLDRAGVVRWRGSGPVDDVRWRSLAAAADAAR